MAADEKCAAVDATAEVAASKSSKRSAEDDTQDDLPQPYNANSLQPVKRRAVSPSDQPRKLKRPGARARISEASRAAMLQRQQERDQAMAVASAAAADGQTAELQSRARGVHEVVRQHYNNVPERGRDWRTTGSKIKGLRVFNNWIKSCIVQHYSPEEDHTPGSRERGLSSGRDLYVLDIGCGKGGDLSKWQQAPQPIKLYVGLDIADVSIEQARDRYRSMVSRGGGRKPPPRVFDALFHVKDCYGESIEDVDIIRQVGFDPSPMNRRGFDVVSMMFSMHYAFESETRARTMLRNVAGALKKGGRFIGCIPNSDVLGERVSQFNAKMAARREAAADAGRNRSAATVPLGKQAPEDGELEEGEAEPTAEWGNSIYRVRFPGKTPDDGVFRPAFGWKYSFFLDEAIEEVPEYVVPWEAFRALAEDFNLELQFHRTFPDIWQTEKDDAELGPLSERMGVRERGGGRLLVTDEEMEAASFYIGFCFYKV